MPKKPLQNWLTIQEQRKPHSFFILEWVSIFLLAWLFWSLMFLSAPGSLSPGFAAIIVSALYASCMVYGRLLQVTGCRKMLKPSAPVAA